MVDWWERLSKCIEDGSVVVGVVGLGYVGLPLAVSFSKEFRVIGYDVDDSKIDELSEGRSYVDDVSDDDLDLDSFSPTSDVNELNKCDFIVISVPTPLKEDNTPDLTYIKESAQDIGGILEEGQFVVLESTNYPGTTSEILVPILEEGSGLVAGEDFGVAFSPERVDPGNKKHSIENTPKVIGGLTPESTRIGKELYSEIIDDVVDVRDCKTAEATKMVENIFRNVNIALVNELAVIFEDMGIDIWEAIEAAKTKPYGFMAFYPGPGVGGHCIPLDPYYLAYRAKQFDRIPRFIETAGEINDYMPIHTVNLARDGLNRIGKEVRNSNVSLLGLSYKSGISDTRESPSLKIIEELEEIGADIRIYDPHIDSFEMGNKKYVMEGDLGEILDWSECVILVTDHKEFENQELVKKIERKVRKDHLVVVDTRNSLNKLSKLNSEELVYIKLGS